MSKNSPKDLKVRTLSAIVMIAVAGSALWAGGWVFTAFVAIVAAGLLWEWRGLSSKFNHGALGRVLWMLGGVVYIGGGSIALYGYRSATPQHFLGGIVPMLILLSIAVDVAAYLSGRIFGGPKIAPHISPSKTWAGLIGAVIGAILVATDYVYFQVAQNNNMTLSLSIYSILVGSVLAVVAQAGDFFESWMKRRAEVKDSGHMIPGHGGLLDRLDGLLAVMFVMFCLHVVDL